MRLSTLAALLLLTLPLEAAAQSHGLNLSWDECGPAGECAKTFACNTNTGTTFELVGSFGPSGALDVDAADIALELWTQSGTVPNWWRFYRPGYCRQTSVSASPTFPGMTYCTDPWQGFATGGLTSYTTPHATSAARAQIGIQFSRPTSNRYRVNRGTEYYAFRLSITPAKTVGTGACNGCFDPMGLLFTRITLYRTAAPVTLQLLSIPLQNGGPGSMSNYVSWQSGSFLPTWGGAQVSCPAAVPARNTTWGAIKSQYR